MSRYRRQLARRHRNALQQPKPVNGSGHSTLRLVPAPGCMSDPSCADCGSPFHGEGSVACEKQPVPMVYVTNMTGVREALGIPEEAPGFAFRIEYQCLVTNNWMPIAALNTRANKASDLVDECKRLAIAHCGEKMRFRIIRPLPGARAVHRIAARKTEAGEVETYSWSS